MDDYDGVEFYRQAIKRVVDETRDMEIMDLVYKLLLASSKK